MRQSSEPTPDAYARDLAADLEFLNPLGAPIDAEALDLVLRYASKNYGAWAETEGMRSNRKFLPDYGDGQAIALACEHADSWLRRAMAAEDAILEMDAAIDNLETWSMVDAIDNLQALAARIRAGREKGAGHEK